MNRSGIITLITDFGITDPYSAMMKGVILSINPDAKIIDISHHIRAGLILQASDMIRETFPFFPKGTVHIAVVDPGVGGDRRLIVLEAGEHFFVGPDNGIFWPVIEAHNDVRIIHLDKNEYFLPHVTRTFHGREVFAPVAAHLSLGVDPEQMGQIIEDPVELTHPMPYKKDDLLCGQVIRIDNFGNLITNISNKELQAFLKESKPIIYIGSMEIKKLDNIYSDVEKGEPLAIINSSDLLEIAVNLGRASEYVGVDSYELIGNTVKVGRYE